LFYAEGPVVWNLDSADSFFKEKIHGYTDGICYFLTTSLGPAETIAIVDNRGLNANIDVISFNDYAYYEKELYNLIGSGREWYSARIDGSTFDTTFAFPNQTPNSIVRVKVGAAGRSKTTRHLFLEINNSTVDTASIAPVPFTYNYQIYANPAFFDYSFLSSDKSFKIGLFYEKYDFSDECYLDNITLNTRSELIVSDYPFFFRDLNSIGIDNIARYTLKNADNNIQVWDITDLNNVYSVRGELTGSDYVFKAPAERLHKYVAIDPTYSYPKPIIDASQRWVGEVPNQNLRGLPTYNYIIVTPDEFLEQAQRLADYHRSKDHLSVLVVTPELIYNEFSAGTPDVSALRDFFRHQYLKSTPGDSLRYVCLFGDGSYNNHSYTKGNTNYILTYESENSLAPTVSHVSDDFFGMLGEGEGEVKGDLDIGIGRLAVKLVDGSDFEATDVVNKILSYDTCRFTDWRRTLCFVGDDGYDAGGVVDGTLHMNDANSYANYVEQNYQGFELRKVYLDAYPQVVTATGASYPEVNRELENLFNKGILVFCYSGHGSENQITSEKILQKSDIESMKNAGVLPLFITATCSFSRFDNVSTEEDNLNNIVAKTSAGEEALLNPDGGAIALLTTTRTVYPGANKNLVLQVFSYLFKRDENGNAYRLGDIVRLAKNGILPDENKYNFVLLGDPALTLAFPKYKVFTDSINHKSVYPLTDTLYVPTTDTLIDGNDTSYVNGFDMLVVSDLDTLKAYSKVTVSGFVAYENDSIISDFNGYVYPQIYDKKTTITTFGNDKQPPFVYQDQKNLLYKGKASVTNGRFIFSFIVPKDIAYNVGPGKISYYAENGSFDAKGEFREVNVGSTVENATPDMEGPVINLYMNDERFVNGGITNTEPFIYALLQDENGINTSGIGFGHDIIGVLDEDINNPYVLNDYYEASVDDYHSGKVRYQLRNLEVGSHELSMKVWDVFNNSSEASIGFVVVAADGLILQKVINYPNPAQEYTQFQYTHNAPDEVHTIVLEVFDMSGRVVARVERSEYESGYVSDPIYWDLRGAGGSMLSPGIYIYRLAVTTSLGTSYINQKLIIWR
jgi:hypothetical protein